MVTASEILALGFEELNYSTDDIKYYKYSVERLDIQDDAKNDYILKVDETEDNPHELQSYLKLGEYYSLKTNGWMGTFTDGDHLDEVFTKMKRWDLSH